MFMPTSPSPKPIEIKISTVVAVSAILHSADSAALDATLQQMTGGVPDFFDDDLAVIDLGPLAPAPAAIDWAGLIALLRRYRLQAVAVRHAPPALHAAILAHGLSLDHGGKARADSAPAAAPVPALVIDSPVRAGQRIYARGGDLVITAVVNNGAEIIADGSIHVYAALHGRALAGASGHAGARIFALSMAPELVSIAGVYRTFEDGFPAELARQPAQVRLSGDRIELMPVQSPTRM